MNEEARTNYADLLEEIRHVRTEQECYRKLNCWGGDEFKTGGELMNDDADCLFVSRTNRSISAYKLPASLFESQVVFRTFDNCEDALSKQTGKQEAV